MIFKRPVSSFVKEIAVDVGGLRFDSCAGQIGRSVTTTVTLLWSCVVKVKSRRDKPASPYSLCRNTISMLRI